MVNSGREIQIFLKTYHTQPIKMHYVPFFSEVGLKIQNSKVFFHVTAWGL